MVTEALLATPLVVIVKFAVVAPAANVKLAGTCAAVVLLLERVTTAPPVGAAPDNVNVPVDEFPPTTEVGFKVTVLSPGTTVTVAVRVAL